MRQILDLAKKTKNADKFDEALKNQNLNNNQNEENDNNKEKDENNEETKDKISDDKKDDNKLNSLINQKNLDPKRLYLRNIPFDITEDDIRIFVKNSKNTEQ